MSRTARCASVLVVLTVLAQQAAAAYITYAQLKPFRNQWNITVQATKTADKSVFVDQVCNATDLSAPCMQPILNFNAGDKLRFTFAQANPTLRTLDNLEPKNLIFRACYSQPFQKDRAWRRATPEIHKDRSCPIVLKAMPYAPTPFTFEYKVPSNTTAASWYAAVYVRCQNGTETSFCQVDGTAAPVSSQPTYWGTSQIQPITGGLKIATAVCSLIAPLFLGSFFLWEFYIKKQS